MKSQTPGIAHAALNAKTGTVSVKVIWKIYAIGNGDNTRLSIDLPIVKVPLG
jgi:hypothetical protein